MTLQPCISLVDRWVLVREADIARAMLGLLECDKLRLEGQLWILHVQPAALASRNSRVEIVIALEIWQSGVSCIATASTWKPTSFKCIDQDEGAVSGSKLKRGHLDWNQFGTGKIREVSDPYHICCGYATAGAAAMAVAAYLQDTAAQQSSQHQQQGNAVIICCGGNVSDDAFDRARQLVS